eukprot:TRINITY_DN15574_c0_g1_i1.p3 TRINITY_DN15574_c0_g1~~TRINITY_DN15574_c0_g1_i1.p3  ORF type:complete len:121 (-),score=15.18 TRINITY_DN15574_c0_g1_i1:277-639(-)
MEGAWDIQDMYEGLGMEKHKRSIDGEMSEVIGEFAESVNKFRRDVHVFLARSPTPPNASQKQDQDAGEQAKQYTDEQLESLTGARCGAQNRRTRHRRSRPSAVRMFPWGLARWESMVMGI